MSQAPVLVRFDAFDLDEANARLTRAGHPVQLPPKAFALLCALARQPGQLIKKDSLLDAVWGHRHVSESVLKTTISQVRAALADDSSKPRYVETVSRHGYRFIGGVRPTKAAEAPLSVDERDGPRIVGRRAEIQILHEAWKSSRAGARKVVWIAGEAGVGKSTLIQRFLEESQAPAVFGHCVEHFGTGEPCLPLLEILRELCVRRPELSVLLRAVSPTWIVQMPWLLEEADRIALQRDLAGAHPDRMVRELRELLRRITEAGPMVLVTEDLHWSDPATLRMIEYFVRQPSEVPLLWLASYRLTQVIAEEHPLAQLRSELRLHAACTEILLDTFSENEVGEYLKSRIDGAALHEDIIRKIHRHTEGLPLFVANVTDNLIAQAEVTSASDRDWLRQASRAPLPVPESLSGVIEKQLRRLPTDVQNLLAAASVCGLEFRAGMVARLLNKEADSIREACDELVERQYWLRHVGIIELPDAGFDSRYAFAHSLYQHVFYQRLSASQRVMHHRTIARELVRARAAGEEATAAELASHHERGHETIPAMKAYAEAAQSALARFAPKAAAELSAHGLSLISRCADTMARREAEFDLIRPGGVAASLLLGVASEQARTAFGRVKELCDALPLTAERAVALNGLGLVHYVRGEFDPALTLARRLDEFADQLHDPLLRLYACNLMGMSLIAQGKLSEGSGYLERGLEGCREIGDQIPLTAFVIDPEVSMRMNVSFPLLDLGFADRGREHLRLGLERAHRIKQPMARMLSHWAGGMYEVRAGNVVAVAKHAAALGQVVEEETLSQGAGPSLWLKGWAEAMTGDPQRGHQSIMQGFECHSRLGMYAGCPEVLGYAVEALINGADWTGAHGRLQQALQLAEQIGERLVVPALHLLGARIALGQKDVEGGRQALSKALAEARRQQARGAELKVLLALAETPGAQRADFESLKRAREALTEGFDLPVYHRAGKVLAGVAGHA